MKYRHSHRSGFSLVEILVAMSILAILVIVMTKLLATSAAAIDSSGKYMTSDGEARQIFNRMDLDISGILKRNDVDMILYKPELNGASGSGANDSLFFYSQAPAYFSSTDLANASPVSLLGYRIDSNSSDQNYLQLERLGQGLTWDNGTSSSTGGLVFLTWDPTSGFLPASLLSSWAAIGAPPYNSVPSSLTTNPASYTSPYEVMGADVIRFEYCFLLKDGSYSDYPVLSAIPTGWNGSYTFFNQTASSPTPADGQSSGGTSGYTAGSRWFNTQTGEGFICMNANPNNAVWAGGGVQDVSAIIVTLAILDHTSRQMLPASSLNSDINTIAGDLIDSGLGAPSAVQTAGSVTLPAYNWNQYIDQNIKAMPVPQAVAAKIRIYQRAFYLKTESIGS